MYCKNGCNMCSYKQNVWKYKLGKKNVYKNRFVCVLLRCTLVWSCYKMLWRDNHTIFEVMITHLHTHTHCWLFQIARSLGLDPVGYTVVPVAKLDEYMNSVRTVHLFLFIRKLPNICIVLRYQASIRLFEFFKKTSKYTAQSSHIWCITSSRGPLPIFGGQH